VTQPKKRRGFRDIVVEGTKYTWRMSGLVEIRPPEGRERRLDVDFGWHDVWLYANDPPDTRPRPYEPRRVTPSFVEAAIRFALDQGWRGASCPGKMMVDYRSGEFSVTR